MSLCVQFVYDDAADKMDLSKLTELYERLF